MPVVGADNTYGIADLEPLGSLGLLELSSNVVFGVTASSAGSLPLFRDLGSGLGSERRVLCRTASNVGSGGGSVTANGTERGGSETRPEHDVFTKKKREVR